MIQIASTQVPNELDSLVRSWAEMEKLRYEDVIVDLMVSSDGMTINSISEHNVFNVQATVTCSVNGTDYPVHFLIFTDSPILSSDYLFDRLKEKYGK